MKDATKQAATLIRGAKRVALATHVHPDPDAIGSITGLALALQSLGKSVVLLNDDPAHSSTHFLPLTDSIIHELPADFHPDLFIGLDASDFDRLGEVSVPLLESDIPSINIDHHVTNTMYGTVNLVMPETAATAEALIHLLDELDVKLSTDMAMCLMTGLVGDTLSFSIPAVTAETLGVAARYVSAGADVALINRQTFNNRTLDEVQLWGLGFTNMTLEDGVLWSIITYDDRHRFGLDETSRTGFPNMMLYVDSAEVAASFSENKDRQIDISMRARPGYDVARIAFQLGGGGHVLAAGCTVDGPLDEAVERVVHLLKNEVNGVKPGK